MPEKVVEEALVANCRSIAYTYSEPIVFYEYVYDTAKLAHLQGIKNVFVSAGYINEQPLRAISKYLDAANIDLKSYDNDTYEMLNAGTLAPVLNTLKVLKEEGVWLEITNLIVPSWTDDLNGIKKMTEWLFANGFQNTPLHFSRFHPDYKLSSLPPTPLETLTKARDIALAAGLNYVYIGNVPGSEGQHTYCPNCKQIVVERNGFQIKSMRIKKGKCTNCQTEIAGVWE
jgi:pyruvate formate lyase activating enzyme